MPRPKKLGLPEFQTPARQKLEQPLKICSPLVGANPKIVAVVTRCFHTGTNTSKKGMALAKRPMLAIPKKTSNTVQLIQPTANSFSSLSPPKNDSNPTWPRVVNRSKKAISNKNNAMKAITWHRKKKNGTSQEVFSSIFFSATDVNGFCKVESSTPLNCCSCLPFFHFHGKETWTSILV